MSVVVLTSTSEAFVVRQKVGEGMGMVRGHPPLRLSEEQLVCLARHFQRRVRRKGGREGGREEEEEEEEEEGRKRVERC